MTLFAVILIALSVFLFASLAAFFAVSAEVRRLDEKFPQDKALLPEYISLLREKEKKAKFSPQKNLLIFYIARAYFAGGNIPQCRAVLKFVNKNGVFIDRAEYERLKTEQAE